MEIPSKVKKNLCGNGKIRQIKCKWKGCKTECSGYVQEQQESKQDEVG